MFILLAQLVAPPIQPGPARLPSREIPASQPGSVQLEIDDEASPEVKDGTEGNSSDKEFINIEGQSPYSDEQTKKILGDCEQSSDPSRTDNCVNKLNAQLQKDGYINSRVVAETNNGATKLIIIPGRLVEINVDASNKKISTEIENKLKPLLDQTFNIITIKTACSTLSAADLPVKSQAALENLEAIQPRQRSISRWCRLQSRGREKH